MSAIPDLKDEITRKSMEAISYLITASHAGRITPHQFATGIDALWMAVAGLIDEDIIDLITAGGNEAPKSAPVEKRVFVDRFRMVVVDRVVGDDTVYLKSYVNGELMDAKHRENTDAAKARDAMRDIAAKLLAAGYTEI
jgi:hypothetical protein